jgi:hypothetical protein
MKQKWFLSCVVSMLLCPLVASAANADIRDSVVSLKLHTQGWVQADSVKLTVGVELTEQADQTQAVSADIFNKLKHIAAGTWHIRDYHRGQSASGLATISAKAEIRLPAVAVTKATQVLKTISKPGESFKLLASDYSPSALLLEKERARLRAVIYQQAQDEINALNKQYSQQHYQLASINFNAAVSNMGDNAFYSRSMNKGSFLATATGGSQASKQALSPAMITLPLSQQLTLGATVQLRAVEATSKQSA